MSRFHRILVAVDGSAGSELALDEAIQLAQTQGAQLRLVHVMDELQWITSSLSAWTSAVIARDRPRASRSSPALRIRGSTSSK
jgi:nucleotide-binding universal stress UspA family protein